MVRAIKASNWTEVWGINGVELSCEVDFRRFVHLYFKGGYLSSWDFKKVFSLPLQELSTYRRL